MQTTRTITRIAVLSLSDPLRAHSSARHRLDPSGVPSTDVLDGASIVSERAAEASRDTVGQGD